MAAVVAEPEDAVARAGVQFAVDWVVRSWAATCRNSSQVLGAVQLVDCRIPVFYKIMELLQWVGM